MTGKSGFGASIARRMQQLVAGMFRLGSAQRPAALRAIERRCAGFIPIAVLLGLFASAFEGIGISMLMPLLGTISGTSDTAGLPTFAVRLRRIAEAVAPDHPMLPLLGIVLVFVLLKAVTQIANATVISSIEQRAGDDIRRALAEKMLTLNYSFFLRQDPARFITIIDTDSWRVTEAVRVVLVGYSAKAAVILFAFLLVAIEWRLSLLVAAGVGLSRLAHRYLHRRLKRLSRAVVQTNRILGEQMIHAVRATRVIRVFGQEQREAATFFAMSDHVRRAMFASDRMAAQSGPIIEIILATAILAVLFASNRLGIGVPYAATYLVLLYRAQIPVMNASNASLRLAALHGAIAEVEWLLSIERDLNVGTVAAAAPPADVADQPVQFHRVSFDYPGQHEPGAPALNHIEMTLQPGTIVALIGESGSGKSTVINLLCRLLEPSSGVIKVGDCALSDIDPDQWRSLIGLAGQDTDLVTGTVAQNIAYGVPEADMAAIEASARLADADAFIRRLPQGYATPLGAIGFGLSGGQRQRIGVARAVLRRPEILILDEATSAVDHESETKILLQLAKQRPYGRAIVVSHDPRTLVHCEFGIVLSAGLVVEAGPIQQLRWYRETFPAGVNQAVPGR